MSITLKPGFEKRHEDLTWRSRSTLRKYSPDQVTHAIGKIGYEPDGTVLAELFKTPEDGIVEDPTSNVLVTVGLQRITNLIIGAGGTSLAHATALCGVGDTSTAATTGDTQLGSNSTGHSRYIVADASYPTAVNGVITMQNTFTTSDGNFVWNEWGWVAAGAAANSDTFAATGTSPVLINHKIASLGTKVSGASWVFSTTITLS